MTSDKNKILILNKSNNQFNFILKYPERILPVTFFLLCILGGLLLYLPFSSHQGISFLDALFTATSAVCVTGLSVVSLEDQFTNIGQIIIMLLIQAGGLGIMTISSIVFILLGKRMSLAHERTARYIFEVESKKDIKDSLLLIFKYTFIVEFIGAIILSTAFSFIKHNIFTGLKYGIFSAVSAFCNAGFFFANDNLVSFNQYPIILYTISFLIILGGISPAICITLFNLFRKKKIPLVSLIVLYMTIILILFGTLFFFISEYDGVLNSLSIWDKINNAWFQSVTARTAGFNSVDLSNINMGTFLLMVGLMIVGGSPGSTAGGLKTTTVGLFFITFWNTIKGRDNIVCNRNIRPDTIQKAITLCVVYFLILLLIILMLLTTQNIHPIKLIFEAVSALGTVGLTMGATTELDGVGKGIIIITMFLGRVTPATLLCYLNTKIIDSRISYPDAKISLT